VVGAMRAGLPTSYELAALVATLVVVTLQVVGASLRWSLKHPYPVDLRSARATPAPPAAMVGYSARLATSTTFTGLLFSGCAHVPNWHLSLIVALPCVFWSATRLVRTRRRWEDPVVRARVISTVAA
jgi:ABC-type Mn2+/Zn2+ transport system permease subunit